MVLLGAGFPLVLPLAPAGAWGAATYYVLNIVPSGGYYPECAALDVHDISSTVAKGENDAKYSDPTPNCGNALTRPAYWLRARGVGYVDGMACNVMPYWTFNTGPSTFVWAYSAPCTGMDAAGFQAGYWRADTQEYVLGYLVAGA